MPGLRGRKVVNMRIGFTKGMIVGSILGASVGMMMEDNGMRKRRGRMMRTGRRLVRASSDVIDNFSGMFR